MSRRRLILLCGLAALAALAAPAATAADLAVSPIRLALTPRQPIAAMTIHNAGSGPTSLQLRVFAWSQKDGEDVLQPTHALVANPGGFDLAPGGRQLARFGLRATEGSGGAYRVLIQELPRESDRQGAQITTLLRISVPIFVEEPEDAPRLSWRLARLASGALSLEASNTGAAHTQLIHIGLARRDGAPVVDQNVSLYVLPGATRTLVLHPSTPVASGEPITLSAASDGPRFTAVLRTEPDRNAPTAR